MNKKTTVTIGIPAFQSERNIIQLIDSLLKQKQAISKIEKIIIYVDGGKDNTAKLAKSIKSKKIQVFSAKKNRGYAYSMQFMINKNKSDVFIGLNDDIKIPKNTLVDEMVKPMRQDKMVGLVSGNVIALLPNTFIGKCIYTSYLAFLPLRYGLKNGQTKLTCDGKILALRKDFAKSFSLTKRPIGTVDIYIYFQNLVQGRKYAFAKRAVVLYRLPETMTDFRAQELRTKVSFEMMKKYFGKIVEIEHDFPKIEYFKAVWRVFLKYPLESILFKLIVNSFYFFDKNKQFSKWSLAITTKKLGLVYLSFQ